MILLSINDITSVSLDFLFDLFRKDDIWKLNLLVLITLPLSCQVSSAWTCFRILQIFFLILHSLVILQHHNILHCN